MKVHNKSPFIFILLFTILVTTLFSSAHVMREIEIQELDISPQLRESQGGPVEVEINKDSTTVNLGSVHGFTIRHGLFGSIQFTNYNLTYDGFEAYFIILHQDIYLDHKLDVPFKLGTRSQTLSESGLRDGLLEFSYVLGDFNDIEGYVRDIKEDIDEFARDTKSQFQYSIKSSIEIVRGTKQNATLNFDFNIASYEIPNIPTDYFHKELDLFSSAFSSTIEMEDTNQQYSIKKIFLFLPIRLLPDYFKSANDHKFNLSEVPIDIFLDLHFDRNDRDKGILVSGGNNIDDPILDNDKDLTFRIPMKLKAKQLIPITISALNYEGLIDIEVKIKIKAIFTDSSLYAKNDYPLSPNTYIIIIVFTATVFIYKVVDYVDYRNFQGVLSYKEYSIVEKEFIG